jgi:hypothetical protein
MATRGKHRHPDGTSESESRRGAAVRTPGNITSMRRLEPSRTSPPSAAPKAEDATDIVESTTGASKDEMLKATTGCKTWPAALMVFREVAAFEEALIEHQTDDRTSETLQTVIALLAELDPRTGTEGLLAAQMIGTQRLAMLFLRRAVVDGQTLDGTNANVARATRLMRLFIDQADAMARQ